LASAARTALQSAPKSMRVKSSQLIKSSGTWTVPAADTKSIGLPADALVPCFLLATWTVSSWQENSRPAIGTCYRQDNLSWPKTFRPPTGTGKKRGTATRTPTH